MITKSKILFAGLDNSGKTSIIQTVRHKFPFTSSTPTIGLDRRQLTHLPCLGMEFIAWDLAGQRKFREQYFTRKKLIFLKASVIFYIIDIQEEHRYYESLQYLHDILNVYHQSNEFPKLFICLHKADPSLIENKEDFTTIKRTIIPELSKCLAGIQYYLYFTSIHDSSSILRAVSHGIFNQNPKSELIQSLLQKYIQMTFSSTAVIFSQELLTIGEFSQSNHYLQACYAATPRFVIAMEKLGLYKMNSEKIILEVTLDPPKFQTERKSEKQQALLFLIPLSLSSDQQFYLTTLTVNRQSLNFCLKYIPKLRIQLQNLLELIISPITE